MSSSTGAARASSNGSSPQPDLSAVELAEENASLRAQLAFSEEEKSALKGELDAARAQHELDATVNTFLEGVASETVVVVDELIDRFRRARPPPLKDATNAQEMTNVEPVSLRLSPEVEVCWSRSILEGWEATPRQLKLTVLRHRSGFFARHASARRAGDARSNDPPRSLGRL